MKYACEYCKTLFDEESDCTSHEHECEWNPDKDDWKRENDLDTTANELLSLLEELSLAGKITVMVDDLERID